MNAHTQPLPDVFSLREIARATRRPRRELTTLVRDGRLSTIDGEFLTAGEARKALVWLTGPTEPVPYVPQSRAALFSMSPATDREAGLPLAASSAVHASLIGVLMLVPWLTGAGAAAPVRIDPQEPIRLVFLATPGPGGGGGGGGLRQPSPPRRALRQGERPLTSPVPPPAPQPIPEPQAPRDVTPPPPEPPINAPVAPVPSDTETRTGVLEQTKAETAVGPGSDGGAGTGAGAGLGEGRGSGIGEGSGGGTGGGPFRPGSGIEPPSLLKEVRPDYSEEARRQRVEGDVLLEIVVRHDGSVGDVRVRSGLGHGLDQRAVQAVRQWRFAPARRRGTPVDVMVEVSVEFKLR